MFHYKYFEGYIYIYIICTVCLVYITINTIFDLSLQFSMSHCDIPHLTANNYKILLILYSTFHCKQLYNTINTTFDISQTIVYTYLPAIITAIFHILVFWYFHILMWFFPLWLLSCAQYVCDANYFQKGCTASLSYRLALRDVIEKGTAGRILRRKEQGGRRKEQGLSWMSDDSAPCKIFS